MNVGFTLSFDSLIHHFYRRHTNRCFVWGSPWKARVWAVWSGAQQSLTRKKLESSWKRSCQYQALKNSSAFKNKKELNIWKIFSVLWKNFQLRVLCILIILKEYPEFHAIKDSGVLTKNSFKSHLNVFIIFRSELSFGNYRHSVSFQQIIYPVYIKSQHFINYKIVHTVNLR